MLHLVRSLMPGVINDISYCHFKLYSFTQTKFIYFHGTTLKIQNFFYKKNSEIKQVLSTGMLSPVMLVS